MCDRRSPSVGAGRCRTGATSPKNALCRPASRTCRRRRASGRPTAPDRLSRAAFRCRRTSGIARAISRRMASALSKRMKFARLGNARAIASPNTHHSGLADPIRRPRISGEKMMRRSVDVSVPPPSDSYLVVAGRSRTSPSPSTSMDEDSTMSWWTRRRGRRSARVLRSSSGSVSRKFPPTIQKRSTPPLGRRGDHLRGGPALRRRHRETPTPRTSARRCRRRPPERSRPPRRPGRRSGRGSARGRGSAGRAGRARGRR